MKYDKGFHQLSHTFGLLTDRPTKSIGLFRDELNNVIEDSSERLEKTADFIGLIVPNFSKYRLRKGYWTFFIVD